MGYRDYRKEQYTDSNNLLSQYKAHAKQVEWNRIQASLNMLAKVVAGENISISIKAEAETAYFDLQNRQLVLPLWADFSKDVADSLRGHEVAHALYTPAGGWHHEVGERAEARGVKFPKLWASCLNVAEDTRIEKLLKNHLPGYRAVMSRAYKDVFSVILEKMGMTQEDMLKGCALNRINYVCKIGREGLHALENDAERVMFTQLMETETWEDVVAVSEKLYDLCLADAANEPLDVTSIVVTMKDKGEGDDGEGEGSESGEGDISDELRETLEKMLEGKEIADPMDFSLEKFGETGQKSNKDFNKSNGKPPRFVPKKLLRRASLWDI
jgi:hypothetical protein